MQDGFSGIIVAMESAKKTLLSGVKPTGRPHIGNYFGAMKQFVDLLNSGNYECYFFIADYHALNLIKDPKELRQHILDLAIDYLAIGLDPERATLFQQSDVPEHTELSCIFDTLVTVPYLERAHAFKDAETKGKEVNVGTFNYPVLMAADILMYDSDLVPVGQDQKQHIEYARDIGQKFNSTFGDTFKIPDALIMKDVATVPGIDGQKMSKSYNNYIPLFASDEEIKKLVMSIVTDSGSEIPKNVYEIHKLFLSAQELETLYEEKKGKYKDLKERLAEDIIKFVTPLREKRAAIAADPDRVKAILKQGAEKARTKASAKMEQVRKAVGVEL